MAGIHSVENIQGSLILCYPLTTAQSVIPRAASVAMVIALCAAILPVRAAPPSAPIPSTVSEVSFEIKSFELRGNSLIEPEWAQSIIAPWIGGKSVFADIERAAASLEVAYRARGYWAVHVFAPEQQVVNGRVLLIVTEAYLGQVIVNGNHNFSTANVRRALPVLQEGKVVPSMRSLSDNVQFANESPARQINVEFVAGSNESLVDAKVQVTEDDLNKFVATVDNTGTRASGIHRLGLAVQSANIFDSDQTLTAAFSTSPDAPKDVKSSVYSLAWHNPIYSLGDSMDVIAGYSSSTSPVTSTASGGVPLNFTGKSAVLSTRWNHSFSREGEYSSKLSGGFDYKDIQSSGDYCTGKKLSSCLPYKLLPVVLTYSGQKQSVSQASDFSMSLVQNIPQGPKYPVDGKYGSTEDRYSFINSANSTERRIKDAFNYFKGNGSLNLPLGGDWLLRAVINLQYSPRPIPLAEQIGIAGSTSVRGFGERAVVGDSGGWLTLETYTPDLAGEKSWWRLPGSLKALAFFDSGFARTLKLDATALNNGGHDHDAISSAGLGLRYAWRRNLSLRLDYADVLNPGAANTQKRGDRSAKFFLQLTY